MLGFSNIFDSNIHDICLQITVARTLIIFLVSHNFELPFRNPNSISIVIEIFTFLAKN